MGLLRVILIINNSWLSLVDTIENENGYRFQNSDFVYLFMLTNPDIKNAYFPNLQKYPKARLLFYSYIKNFPI